MLINKDITIDLLLIVWVALILLSSLVGPSALVLISTMAVTFFLSRIDSTIAFIVLNFSLLTPLSGLSSTSPYIFIFCSIALAYFSKYSIKSVRMSKQIILFAGVNVACGIIIALIYNHSINDVEIFIFTGVHFIFSYILLRSSKYSPFTLYFKNILGITLVMLFLFTAFHYLYDGTTFLDSRVVGTDLEFKNVTQVYFGIERFIWSGVDPNFHAFHVLIFWSTYLLLTIATRPSKFQFIIVVLGYVLIVATFSRTAFIISTLILVWYLFSSRQSNFIKALIMTGTISTIFAFEELYERVLSIGDNIAESGGTGRFERIEEGLRILSINPLGSASGVFSESSYLPNSHNTFIQFMIELSIPLATIYFCSFALLIMPLLKASFYGFNRRFIRFALFCIIMFTVYMNTIPVSDFRPLAVFVVVILSLPFCSPEYSNRIRKLSIKGYDKSKKN
ncbi:hypothetical protein BFR57_03360 [Idiomarina sp. MD25a]|uniref:hypothetical protein n=1 Tax=Idiomarina sp. MD25a TaxID=1889913 RepID=UPI0008F856CB|nr:hypothetical protein [Idiomarina sp. MD25a]OIM99616.1 hypothetical protein BFR57_03360 [Idiomarina sp. MD25a]